VVALGSLELLWAACYESGEEYLGDAADVEALAGWQGSKGVLCEALAAAGGEGHAGFIEPTVEGHYKLHDLWDHAPDYVRKRRSREQERRTTGAALQSMPGQSPVADQTLTGQGPPNGSQRPPNGETRAPAPAPSPTPAQAAALAPAGTELPPNPAEALAERYPHLHALVSALDDAGLGRSLPRNATSRGALDQLTLRHGVEALVADVARAPEGQSLAWYATRWAAADFTPPRLAPVLAVVGAEGEWWRRAPRESVEAFLAERARIAPELADAPVGLYGHPEREDVRALAERFAVTPPEATEAL
jgi:hypothetical protein